MTINLIRTNNVGDSTLGQIFVDNKFLCYTLEDKVRDEKVKHHTAIKAGTYELVINKSNRFKSLMPLLLNVPDFEGVRIHKGNTIEDTSGCILVGDHVSGNTLSYSATAYQKLFDLLNKNLNKGKVYLKIEDMPKPVEPIKVEAPVIVPPVIEIPRIEIPIIVQPKLTWFQKLLNIIKQWIQISFKS